MGSVTQRVLEYDGFGDWVEDHIIGQVLGMDNKLQREAV
jgi:hypothetical protein